MGELHHTILVVDDTRSTADAAVSLLRSAGHEVQTAPDGAAALKRVGEGGVDLVLLDVELPGMDGLQALRLIRAASAPLHLPVLLMSVREDRDKRLTAFKLGADDFIQKPWDADELLLRVGRHLALRDRMAELLRQTEQLHQLSITDGLTGLHNHRFFQERIKEEFRRAQRYDDPLALILLDVDHFKEVNDRLGQPVGDQVLKEVAGCLRTRIRDTDILARYGGEEFGVLLPRTHLAGALTVAERIWRGMAEVRAGNGQKVEVTASLGVSGFPSRQVFTPEQLLRTADEALYRAKREGRNKICLYQQVSFFSDPPARAS